MVGAVLSVIAMVAALAGLGAAAAVDRHFRDRPADPVPPPAPGLSMIVPIRGADATTEANLDALVRSVVTGPVEYLFAMESTADPAFPVCERVRQRHPDLDIRVVIAGPAGERMGKQHNVAAAAARAKHPVVGSMDADVRVDPDTLAAGLRRMSEPDAGIAYFLPHYRGPDRGPEHGPERGSGPAGGILVALYSNYYYQLYMGAYALRRNAPFITGALWLMSPAALARIGGFEQFGATLSDDAALGRAVVGAGLRTVLVPRSVAMAYEPLSLRAGARHLLKWLTLLRAEGVPTYCAVFLLWHPMLWAALGLAATVATGATGAALAGSVLAAAFAVAARYAGVAALHRRAYGPGGRATSAWLLPYELIAAPILFARGLFSRRLDWRGRRYTVGRHGAIRSVSPADTRQP